MILKPRDHSLPELDGSEKARLRKLANKFDIFDVDLIIFEKQKVEELRKSSKSFLKPGINLPQYIYLAFLRCSEYDTKFAVEQLKLYFKNARYAEKVYGMKPKLDSDWIFNENFKQ